MLASPVVHHYSVGAGSKGALVTHKGDLRWLPQEVLHHLLCSALADTTPHALEHLMETTEYGLTHCQL